MRLLGAAGTSLATGATASAGAMEGSILSIELRAQDLDRILRGSCRRDVESCLYESKAMGDWDVSHPTAAVCSPATAPACKANRLSPHRCKASAETPRFAEHHPVKLIHPWVHTNLYKRIL